jgi:hypothetical protein
MGLLVTKLQRHCRSSRVLLGALLSIWIVILPLGSAAADSLTDPSPVTAGLQNLPDAQAGLAVMWNKQVVSALPFRIRILDQASPLAYSLDIRRRATYGSRWSTLSLGEPSDSSARSFAQLGVANPLPAELIARGGADSFHEPVIATTDLEYAARQVAIWAVTNSLALNPRTVPNADLLLRAKQLYQRGQADIKVPLQVTKYGVQIFVRETTANTVRLAVQLSTDNPGNTLDHTQDIDLYLDGTRCQITTQQRTEINLKHGVYTDAKKTPLGDKGSTSIAEVDLHRNTKVVDASAAWIGIDANPGLPLVNDGAAPPIITADKAILHFESSTRLDPANYTGPRQLLDKTGIVLLGRLPNLLIIPAIALALYVLSRLGRMIDSGFKWGYAKVRRKKAAVVPRVSASTVVAEAPSVAEATQAALMALDSSSVNDVDIVVVETPHQPIFGRARPAKVRVSVKVRP